MVKAARALGLPTLMLVWSWDNLSSKAVLHEHPDRLLVWNETQAREAEELHGVRPSGSRSSARPTSTASSPRSRPQATAETANTIVYLGSSTNVAPDEPDDLRPLARGRTRRAEPPRRRGRRPPASGRRGLAGLDAARAASRCSGRRRRSSRGARRAARRGRRRRRPEHERRDRGGDRRPARADVPCRRGRARPGGLDPLRLPARAERRLRARRGHARGSRRAARPGAREARTTPARLERFVERFVRPRGLDEPVAPIVAAAALELAGAQPATLGGAA